MRSCHGPSPDQPFHGFLLASPLVEGGDAVGPLWGVLCGSSVCHRHLWNADSSPPSGAELTKLTTKCRRSRSEHVLHFIFTLSFSKKNHLVLATLQIFSYDL